MCFYIKKGQKAIKTEVNIACYKYVEYAENKDFEKTGKLISIVARFLYHIGYEYSHAKTFRRSYEEYNASYGEIMATRDGFHSYIEPSFIPSFGKYLLIKCIIPKGAYYYFNHETGEYFSNRIIIDHVIKTIEIKRPKTTISKKTYHLTGDKFITLKLGDSFIFRNSLNLQRSMGSLRDYGHNNDDYSYVRENDVLTVKKITSTSVVVSSPRTYVKYSNFSPAKKVNCTFHLPFNKNSKVLLDILN